MFVNILFGHLFGDFIFQNNWMALNKSKSSFHCLIHCLIYTLCVLFFTWYWNPYWALLVFLSHYPIDRYSLIDNWLNFIKGRSLGDYLNSTVGISNKEVNMNVLQGSFGAIVYTVADNTIHLALMWYGWILFFN